MSQPSRRRVLLAVASVAVLAAAGCGKKDFTPEQFNSVEKGMTEAQVVEVLGKPDEALEAMSTRRLFWVKGDKYYSISFKDGKVEAPLAHANKEDYMLMKGLMQAAKQFEKK